MMIVFIRCNDIISDSRAKKYIEFYDRIRCDYKVIAWDRLGISEKVQHAIYCPTKSKYNQGGLQAIVDRLKWMWFILKTLFKFKDNLRIHACDLDAAFPATIYKLFSRRNNYVLFDVFDWISDTLYNQGKIVTLAFNYMEKLATKHADHIIICEPERVKQIPYNIEGRYSVLQNIPSFENMDFLSDDNNYKFDNGKTTLAYVGGFTEDRCLHELIQGAEEGCFNLNIAGYGNKNITERLNSLNKCSTIRYYGKVAYKDGLRIMYNSDIVYAMYSKVNPNHFFAAPNKYYETMFVGKPVITTAGIIIADKVKNNNIGYVIDESYSSLISLIDNIDKDDIKEKSQIAKKMWKQYRNATLDYLNTTYKETFLV